jgi:hypothetical protein
MWGLDGYWTVFSYCRVLMRILASLVTARRPVRKNIKLKLYVVQVRILRFRTSSLESKRPRLGSFTLLAPSADKENRTPIFSLATRRFTTKLYPLESLKHGDYTGVFEGGNS